MTYKSAMRLYLSKLTQADLIDKYAHCMLAYASNAIDTEASRINRSLLREELDARQIAHDNYDQEAAHARAIAQANAFIADIVKTTPSAFRNNRSY